MKKRHQQKVLEVSNGFDVFPLAQKENEIYKRKLNFHKTLSVSLIVHPSKDRQSLWLHKSFKNRNGQIKNGNGNSDER